jgi:hypothetical protein
VPTSGNAFNRKALEKVFPVDERFRICADAWILYRTAAHGKVLAIEETLAAYRIHGANNYAGSYVGTTNSNSRMLKVLQNKLSLCHAKIDACLWLEKRKRTLFSISMKHLDFLEIRVLLLSRHMGVAGPSPELGKQFTFLKLHTLLLAKCLTNEATLTLRLQTLAESIILCVLPTSWKKHWLRVGFILKRRAQSLLGRSQPV